MDQLLQNLPNGGAVAAILVCTWFFLNRQDKGDANMKSIVETFTHELNEARKAYLDHLRELTKPKDKPPR